MSASRSKALSELPAGGDKRHEKATVGRETIALAGQRSAPADTSFTHRAYCRCNGGDYFQGEFCPFDGWSSNASRELTQAVARLAEHGIAISLDALAAAGASPSTLQRTIVVAFGSGESAFEAIAPKACVVGGVVRPLEKLGRSFT